jgi:hypothetical protein
VRIIKKEKEKRIVDTKEGNRETWEKNYTKKNAKKKEEENINLKTRLIFLQQNRRHSWEDLNARNQDSNILIVKGMRKEDGCVLTATRNYSLLK